MKEGILEERHYRGELVEEKVHGGGFWTSEAGLRGGEKTRRWLGEGGDSGWSSWRTEVVEAVESEALEAGIRMEKEFVEKENMREDYFIGCSSWRWLINSRGRRRWQSFSI